MLTVIIDARDSAERLPVLLAQLTSAAVDGLIREVLIAGGEPFGLLEVLREETGAELVGDVGEGARAARGELVLLLPAAIRLRTGWIEALSDLLRSGAREAVLVGEGGGLLRPAPVGALAAKALVSAHPDLKRLRRKLGSGAPRLV